MDYEEIYYQKEPYENKLPEIESYKNVPLVSFMELGQGIKVDVLI